MPMMSSDAVCHDLREVSDERQMETGRHD